ncbi:MAG: peptidylprolyl isomerase [Sphingobacteriaceae bacterium]|jgi:peptidyl-prolyl cis-trans isomerase SurA
MLKRLAIALFSSISIASVAQVETIDKVIGVVGKYPILLSDIQNAMLLQEKNEEKIDKCGAFEQVLFQKLLIAQADRDSVEVTDAEIENELNKRMNYYISQFGSEEKLEQFYGKRTNVIKDDFRADVQEQLLAQKMQGRIAPEGKLSPAEVRAYFNTIPEDSLPLINSEYELQQLVKKPTYSAEAKKEAKDKTEEYRQRVLKGESISILARLYSEDPGSAKEGGLIANVFRGQMTPEFEAVAFRLKNGEISTVFETPYGYHFMQLVSRKGDLLDLRHILVIPKMSNADYYRSKLQLDSIAKAIRGGSISFEEAVKKFSDDKETAQNNGLMINPMSASTKWTIEEISQIDQKMVLTINELNIGEISKTMEFMNYAENKPAFRIIKLKNRIDPHKANMKDDYQKLSQMASSEKSRKALKDWIKKRSKITYIKIDEEYKNCKFENNWIINN